MSAAERTVEARAFAHPLRVSIVRMMTERGTAISPLELATQLGQSLGVVAYHVRYLHELGMIELVRTQSVRGAHQSFYAIAVGTDVLALRGHAQATSEPTGPAEETTGPPDAAALKRALTSSLRRELLRELADSDRSLSPRELSVRLGKPLGTVSYHVRYLLNLGCVALARTELVRSAIAHFYVLTPGMRERIPLAPAQPSTSSRAK